MNDTFKAKGINNIEVKCNNTTGGKLTINLKETTTKDNAYSIEFGPGTSNFVATTELRADSPTQFSTKILDYKQTISAPKSVEDAQKYSSLSITENGILEITYSNGDKLSVYEDEFKRNQFKY